MELSWPPGETRPHRLGLDFDSLQKIQTYDPDTQAYTLGVRLVLDDAGTVTSARVALGAVGPKVVLAEDAAATLVGSTLDDAALEALATACSAASTPIDDKRGTVDFRKQVAGVLARRAARIAYTRAGGN